MLPLARPWVALSYELGHAKILFSVVAVSDTCLISKHLDKIIILMHILEVVCLV